MTCDFVYSCTGYYDYESGHDPVFAGRERFRGTIVHPQKWPAKLDYAGKRVVVIGSGATAITVVPEMAKTAAHVTMLQRSPTYVASIPSRDKIANGLRKRLPSMLAYQITRWKNVGVGMAFFQLSRRRPKMVKDFLVGEAKKALGAKGDVAAFTPTYNPWDQRVCVVPDGDLFESIKEGRVSVVTDHVDSFTEKGISLKSGKELEADLIVTATGIEMLFLGGIELSVDGEPIRVNEKLLYKGMMLEDVPNLAITFGYTNASWTLKADLTAEYVCRLLAHMDRHGVKKSVPKKDPSVREAPFLTFSSGYVQRAKDVTPKQGDKAPWKLYMNFLLDTLAIRYGEIADGTLKMSGAKRSESRAPKTVLRPVPTN